MKILAFGASNSKNSINKQLATYAASLVENAEVETLDINDYEMPIFSIDRENEIGQHPLAKDFCQKIAQADALIISYSEHNGTYSAAYKNLFDWASRVVQKVYQEKPMIILATSPGPGGAASVLNTAVTSAPFFSASVVGSLSVPNFFDNFDQDKQVLVNDELAQELQTIVNKLN